MTASPTARLAKFANWVVFMPKMLGAGLLIGRRLWDFGEAVNTPPKMLC